MKSKFSHIFSSILWFFKAIIAWLSRRFRIKKSDTSVDVEVNLDSDAEYEIEVHIQNSDQINDKEVI